MTRDQRILYQIGVTVAAVAIIGTTSAITECRSPKTAPCGAENVSKVKVIEETEKRPTESKKTASSAMPCENPERFREWMEAQEETSEPETEEKTAETTAEHGEVEVYLSPSDEADTWSTESTRFYTASEEVESEVEAPETIPAVRLYRIAGDLIPEDIQTALRAALDAEGIGCWYEGALAQMYQESHGDAYAENPNGLDKGLMQYRITYWPAVATAYGEPGADIFDWQAQLRVYARQTAARINAGLSTDEIISRHKTSDDNPAIDAEYIRQVRQWLWRMEAE